MTGYSIIEIDDDNISMLQPIADEAIANGDAFVEKTIREWRDGTNKFSKPNEQLWGVTIDENLVGIGGLNQDIYVNDPAIGRVRHVYIAKNYRGRGLSKVLLRLIIDRASAHFKTLRLYTDNPVAGYLYESMGFEKEKGDKVSHIIKDLKT